MKGFLQKNWLAVLAVVLALVIVGITVYYAYFKGKSGASAMNAATDPNQPLTDNEKVNVNDLAKRLQEDIYCFVCMRDTKLYETLAGATDKILASVYNQYRELTGVDLITDMQGEKYFLSGGFGGVQANADKIIQRLKTLFQIT